VRVSEPAQRAAPAAAVADVRAVRVALVVGAVLFAINQLDVVLRGEVTPVVAAKILLTFAVPYTVSTYSALQVNRLR